MTGSVSTTPIVPADSNFGPSAAATVIGTPSPLAPNLTGSQPVGNSSDYSWSFSGFIDGLEKKAVGAVTSIGNSLKYEKAKVQGTIQKAYYQTQAAFYETVTDAAQGAQNVAKKVTGVSTTIFIAIALFVLAPYVVAWLGRKK